MSLLCAVVPVELHHGDCVEADAEAHSMSRGLLIPVIIHPPVKDEFRAFCWSEDIREPKPYYDRNQDIVDETSYLIACPKQDHGPHRTAGGSWVWPTGGTWWTAKYAVKTRKPVYVLYPSGRIDRIPDNGVPFP